MKWIVIGIVLVMLFAVFRRMNRDTVVAFWQQRPEMPFEEFYSQFYGTSGLERDEVRMVLNMIARATRVPESRILPSDRVDDLKPGVLESSLAMLQRVLDSDFAKSLGLPHPASWNAETVDDVIRLLAPYYEHIHVTVEKKH
jgi:hypothetical protein